MAFFRWLKRMFGFGVTPNKAVAHGSAVADLLARTRGLTTRDAQWPDIWAALNPADDPTVRELLLELRNDGLQFAPSDGLRRIELACEELANDPQVDAVGILRRVLGKTDVLDRYR